MWSTGQNRHLRLVHRPAQGHQNPSKRRSQTAGNGGAFVTFSPETERSKAVNLNIKKAEIYAADTHTAFERAPFMGVLVALGWLAFPFALQSLIYPQDIVAWQHVFQGEPVPSYYTTQQLHAGLVQAGFILAVLILLQMVGTVLFYRKVRLDAGLTQKVAAPPIWPLAAIAAGVIGNGIWWAYTGYFDLEGMIVGFTPAALTVGCEMLCEKLGQDFVFGPNGGPNQYAINQIF
jgi:hypothetical protein